MIKQTFQSGFSAVELLITLFIAFLFVMMGYQLYSVAIQGSGESRAKAKASNLSYTYLRAYAGIAFTNPSYDTSCTTPFNAVVNYAVPAEPNTLLNITICTPPNTPQLRLVTSKVSTGNPTLEVTHAIYAAEQ